MRRAIAAVVMGGLVLGGAVATPSVAAVRGEGKAPGLKTVVYQGYEFQVPASWPVYRLDEHPQTCVRYDVHAVYLGTPGTNMRCPAGLVGRTQTVSFIPGTGAATGSPAGGASRAAASAASAAGGTELQRLAAVHSTVTQNAVQHKLEVALGAARPGATVVGTYGSSPAVVEQVLNTLRLAPEGSAPTAQSALAPPVAPQRASAALPPSAAAPAAAASGASAPKPVYTSWHGVPAHWPVEIVPTPPGPTPPPAPTTPPAPKPVTSQPVPGFDTCGAQPAATMRAWRSVYAAVGVYIGGVNVGCNKANLSASWVRTMTGMGWGLLPTYVGPQAPCWGLQGVLISPGTAVAQGKAAAADAVSSARAVGLPAGAPIYYDMEAYRGPASCKSAVLNFLGAWDSGVLAAGYVTGVYSSQASGIVDMQAAATSVPPGFTPPEAIWIALWDNVSSLRDGALSWPLTARAKQFAGNVNQTIGGITLNIDKDLVGGPMVGGPVAGLPGSFPQPGDQTSSRDPPWTHKLTTWPYAATALTPSST